MLQDLRYSLRQLRKSPGFTIVVILTLAVGIGAVTTVVTWANAVMFNPWPQVREAQRLRFMSAVTSNGGGYSQHYDQLQYLRQNARNFSDLTANEIAAYDLAGSGSVAQRYWGGVVASNYFQFLGVQPVLGRGFTPQDDRAYGSAPEVVISYDLWHARFHGDPAILGKAIQVNRHPLTVVGVAPKGFAGIYGGLAQSLWAPLSELAEMTGRPDPWSPETSGCRLQCACDRV